MIRDLGRVAELVRYPVKSMAGIPAQSAFLGWNGLTGDRRFAFRRIGDESSFPWLQASKLAELLLYKPRCRDEKPDELVPTHVRTPDGVEFELRSADLASDISARLGSRVELTGHKNGIFDDAPVSIISRATIAGIGDEAGLQLDRRRFRANILLDTDGDAVFLEDQWVGATLMFGTGDPRPAVRVIMRDPRCVIINLDPDTAQQDPRVLKTVVRLNKNDAGVYGNVIQTGMISVGDPVRLIRDAIS